MKNKKTNFGGEYTSPHILSGDQLKIISAPTLLSLFSNNNECFRIGNIPFEHIFFEDDKYLNYDKKLDQFIEYTKLLETYEAFEDFLKNDKSNNKYMFSQIASQVKDWLNNKKFNFYPSAFWSPENNRIFVHPGKNRYEIMKMFPIKDGEYKFIFWNTGGYYDEWMNQMKKVDCIELLDTYCLGGYVLDHNSIIPHVFPTKRYVAREVVSDNFKSQKEIYNKLKIYTKNETIKKYLDSDKFTESAKMATARVKINENALYPSLESYKAFLCIFAVVSYKDENLEVTIL